MSPARVERLEAKYWEDLQKECLMVCLQELYDRFQEMTKGGRMYGQKKLSPEAAMMKRASMGVPYG